MSSFIIKILKSILPTVLNWIAGKFSDLYARLKHEKKSDELLAQAVIIEGLRRELIAVLADETMDPDLRTQKISELKERLKIESRKLNSN